MLGLKSEKVGVGACRFRWNMPLGITLMPATRQDIEELKSIVRELEKRKSDDIGFKYRTINALKKAIQFIEEGSPGTPFWWTLGALKQSLRKTSAGRYVVTYLALNTWACDQAFALIPDETEH